jgi:N-acetylglucosamine-6-phosphate deacetylase
VTTILHAEGICLPGPPGVAAAGVVPEIPPGIRAGWVAFDGARIEDAGAGVPPAGAVDLGAVVLAPAFVDLQVNGLGAVDLAGAAPTEITDLTRELGRRGVGALCPTLTSQPADAYGPWLDRIAEARRDAAGAGPAAALLGAHLEGPFLGAPGAHDRSLLRAADAPWLERLLDAHHDEIAMVTLAPEADPGLAATRTLAGRGVTVALGHSSAADDVVAIAVDAGATVVTHLFNAMGPLHHRAPGLAAAALVDPRLTPTVIGDGVHVHPDFLRIVFAAKPRVALVSDTVATGAPAGALTGAPRETDGAARLADGTLAGATVTLDRAMANVVGLGVPLRRAVAMATEVPAELVRAGDRGRLVAGARADVVALDPRDASVKAVWLGGCEVRR